MLLFLNGLAVHSGAVRLLAIFASSFLVWIMGAVALVVTWKRAAMMTGALATSIVFVVNYAVAYLIYFRARPMTGLTHLIEPYSTKSFPSDHAAIAIALAWTVASVNPKLGLLMAVCGIVVAIGRVAVGVHYPSDVLGGIVVGTLAYFIAKQFIH